VTGTPTFLVSGHDSGSPQFGSSASTNYFYNMFGANFTTNTEANAQLVTRAAGDFSRIGVLSISNTRTTATSLKLRVNGAAVNNVASITASTSGWFEDTTPHTDTVADGDLVCGTGLTGTGAGTMFITTTCIKFVASSGAVWYPGWASAGDSAGVNCNRISTASQNNDVPTGGANGGTSASDTGANAKWRIEFRGAGTMSHIHTRIITNGRSTNTTFLLRVNNADGSGTVSVTSSTTGTFEDTTNSDSISAGGVVNFRWTTGTGTGNLDTLFAVGKMVGSGSKFDVINSRINGTTGEGTSSGTNYHMAWGYTIPLTANTDVKSQISYAVTASYLRCYVAAGNTGALTLHLQKNGSDATLAVSITSATTGYFADSTNTDALADGDYINYSHGAMSSIFGFVMSYIAMSMDPGSGGGGPPANQTHRYNTVILG